MSTAPTPAAEIPLRTAEMHLYKPTDPATATITKSEICTASKKAAGFCHHIEFDVAGSNLVGRAIPGQSIGVLAPGLDALGRPHKLRLYSLASPSGGETGDGTILSTTVKRTLDEHWESHKLFTGVCSNYLCDLQVGDQIKLTGPAGKKFVLPQAAHQHDYIFFATGTGIAPFRGMILDLLRAPDPAASRIALIMGSPYASDLMYDPLFRELAAKHPNFYYIPAISRERNDKLALAASPGVPGALPKLYVQDRLATDPELLGSMLKNPRTLIYICGIAGMEIGIFQQLPKLLSGSDLEQYLTAPAELLANTSAWQRSMLHKEIHLSRRISMEVYA